MFKALFNGFHFLLKKPFLVLLSMIFLLATASIAFLLADYWIELILFFILPPAEVSFEILPFYFIAVYPLEITAILFIMFISLFLFNWLFNSIAVSLINETPSVKASFDSLKNWKKHLGLSVFYFIAGLLFFTAFFLLLWFASQPGLSILFIILVILILLLTLFGFIFGFRFIFIPIAMAFEENTKKAIQKSWHFTSKNFIKSIALFFIVFLIYFMTSEIALYLSDLIPEELISNLVFLVISSIGLTYALITLTEFFHRTHK
ncbi:MAG: glycerophosphoryl diester phosphodiesterase membrane domain-containing protein [Candidatus Diapherotrites archaeon]|nr:glycerophosphoryl diester phosphodiesterase membrane domain-containing protein [Candidatus Diapherotrites archaeon]